MCPSLQVLELQNRLEERDAQLAAVTAQLQAAGPQPDTTAPQALGARASLADISNARVASQHASPTKQSIRVGRLGSAMPKHILPPLQPLQLVMQTTCCSDCQHTDASSWQSRQNVQV